jgi:hypothetical protein
MRSSRGQVRYGGQASFISCIAYRASEMDSCSSDYTQDKFRGNDIIVDECSVVSVFSAAENKLVPIRVHSWLIFLCAFRGQLSSVNRC